MTEIAAVLKITFLALIVFYICIQVALLISEVRSAEHAADVLPRAFLGKVSLEQHRKAIDFTAEIVQSDTINALIGAGIALLFTLGGGIDILWAFISVLSDQGIVPQFVFVMLILLILSIVDLPFDWWRNFRIWERYGMERTDAKQWIRTRIRTTAVGWLADMPLFFILLLVLNLSSYFWWIFCLMVSFSWFLWHECIYPNWVVGFSKKATPMPNGSLRRRLQSLLSEQGFPNAKIVTCTRPKQLVHCNAILAKRGSETRLVLFNHILTQLSEEEVLAVTANAVARVAHWHHFARCLLFFLLNCLFWWGFAWLSEKTYFYEALGIHPAVALANGAVIPGVLVAIAITVFPIILYPFIFFVHMFTRMLEYDADAYVVQTVGSIPLINTIVKLHTDYRNSLTPNRLYSLANHRRPHVTHRIIAAEAEAGKLRRLALKARQEKLRDRQALFNSILLKRETERLSEDRHTVQLKQEQLREAKNLLNRTYTTLNN